MNKANNKWAFNNLYDQVMDLSDKNIQKSKILVRNFFKRDTRQRHNQDVNFPLNLE